MNKPMKDWTLGECKEWCSKYDGECPEKCPFEDFCTQLQHEPAKWDLEEKPRFTQQEVELAKALYDFRRSESVVIGRNKGDVLWWRDGDSAEGILPYKLFPSLNCGDSVKLSDIIGGIE